MLPVRSPAALELLRRNIAAHDNALTTGMFSTKYLCNLQEGQEFARLVAQMVMRPGFPGWRQMLARGATTLWESWRESNNTFSHNHPMFGSLVDWLAQSAWGVAVAPEAVAANQIVVRPQPPAGLTGASGSYRTPHGLVELGWWLERRRLHLSLVVPEGVRARVWVREKQRWIDVAHGRHQW